MPTNTSTATAILSGVVFVASLVGVVVLEATGHDSTPVMVLAGPVVSALFVVGTVGSRLGNVADKVDKVEQQTNGALDRRFAKHAETAATSALVRAGVVTRSAASRLEPVDDPPADSSAG